MSGLLSFGLNILADVFYPKYCFGCKRAGNYLCKFCMSQIPALALNFCAVCNTPSANGFTHLRCSTRETPDRLLSAFSYSNAVIADMIITGKYYFVPEVFSILGALMTDCLFLNDSTNVDGFVVCALPLHSKRLRWRGFNQSEVAAKILSQGLHLPLFPVLKRIKNTQTQKELNAEQRKQNINNAFYIPLKSFIPEKVLLIDDVTTTGQTFLEASRVLKQAGVKTVWCISIAKD